MFTLSGGKNNGQMSANFLASMKNGLLRLSFFNLLLVALVGLLMRGFAFLPAFPLQYNHIVHGHSHFAFGGWVMPLMIWLILQYFPGMAQQIRWQHWRNVVVLTFFSAYGMLLTFPLMGYAPLPILFSTLSILACWYLAILLWKPAALQAQTIAIRFLRAGLFYMILATAGPFATAPIAAIGYAGTPLYYNAVYFYLHFLYNGWFLFTLLAVLYCIMEQKRPSGHGKKVFLLFQLSCTPAYFLSTLWSEPGIWFNMAGGVAAAMQVTGVYFLYKDLRKHEWPAGFLHRIMTMAFAAFALKNVLQLVGAFPAAAALAYQHRNFMISYLHLVLVGCVSLAAIGFVLKAVPHLAAPVFRAAAILFLFAFIATELLMVLQPIAARSGFAFPRYPQLVFAASVFFPVAAALFFIRVLRSLRIQRHPMEWRQQNNFNQVSGSGAADHNPLPA